MNRESAVALSVIALLSLLICGLIAFLDHEVRSLSDLLQLQNVPVIVLLSSFLAALLTFLYWPAREERWRRFLAVLTAESLVVGGLVWSFTSHASSGLGQLRNFILLAGVTAVLLFFSVIVAYWSGRLVPR